MDLSLYQKFEETIHNPTNVNSLLQLITAVPQNMTKNINYTLDRILMSGLSTDIGIKLNACSLLQIFQKTFSEEINRLDLIQKIKENSDQSKALKKNQKTAYLLGRFLLLKSLSPLNKEQYKIVSALLKPLENQTDLTEHILESMNQLYAKLPQQTKLSLIKAVKTTNQKDEYLKKYLLLKPNKDLAFDQQQIDKIIQILITELPKQSSIPSYIIKSLKLNTQGWKKFWKHLVDKFGDQDKYNYKGIWIVLDLLQHRVSGTVDQNVIESIKVTQLWDMWMNELNVMNKKGKEKAFNIQINIGDNKKIANDLIRYIHDNQIYLNNLHFKHPLINIYKLVDVQPYLKYLISEIEKNEDKQEWISQLYSIIHINFDKVSDKTLVKVIHILIKYNLKFPMGEKYVQMIWSIINMKNKTLKSNQVHEFNILVFNSIMKDISKTGLPEQQISQLKQVYDQSIPKTQKLPQNLKNPFKNFVVNALIFSILWNQQIQICLQFPEWLSDLVVYIKRVSGEQVPTKKKIKKNKDENIGSESQNKPINILIEYFTSFLTKSPTFLRNSIQKCFQECVQYYAVEDLQKLLAVVFKPDADYIEQQQ